MSGETHTTTDPVTIRRWAEERGGEPATVAGTSGAGEESGVLRLCFPQADGKDSELRRIDWSEFFDKFEAEQLAFLYQTETRDDDTSRFFKFVAR